MKKYEKEAIEAMQRKGFILNNPLVADNCRHVLIRSTNRGFYPAWYIATRDYIIIGSLLVSYGLMAESSSYSYFSHAGILDELEGVAQLQL